MLTIGGLVFAVRLRVRQLPPSPAAACAVLEALPFEMLTIGGAALGTFVMANSMHDVKHTLGEFSKILKGAAYNKPDYIDLLSLLFFLVRLASTKGTMALEPHIEKPTKAPASRNSRTSSPTTTPARSSATTCAWWA